jgi:elongation factor P
MATTADIRNGTVFRFNGELHQVTWFQHHKPGKGGAFMRTKLRRLADGAVFEQTFRSGAEIEIVRLDTRDMQYLYTENSLFYFMDMETYDQLPMTEEQLGDRTQFLRENTVVTMQLDAGTPVTIELPAAVELTVVETDPGLRGDTVQAGTKSARLETGLVVQVPLFIGTGTAIRVDTRTGEYLGRV